MIQTFFISCMNSALITIIIICVRLKKYIIKVIIHITITMEHINIITVFKINLINENFVDDWRDNH